MRPSALLLLAAGGIALAGCDGAMWWKYRDDPYLSAMADRGEQDALKNANSVHADVRQTALRILADRADRARRAGAGADANRLEGIIIRRYRAEKDQSVRACVVLICAPAVGRGSARMAHFLRERIASGEFPGYAALALASLGPRGAFADIAPLARHPDHDIRLQAATALTALGDPRGYETVCRVWRGMHTPAWPGVVDGEALAAVRAELARRAERMFGMPLK